MGILRAFQAGHSITRKSARATLNARLLLIIKLDLNPGGQRIQDAEPSIE